MSNSTTGSSSVFRGRSLVQASYARSQFPIVPAFATTIHKAQSATIDCVGIFLDHMFTHDGQLYVAMSRMKKATDLYFFGAPLPLDVKRHNGVDVEAINISRGRTDNDNDDNNDDDDDE